MRPRSHRVPAPLFALVAAWLTGCLGGPATHFYALHSGSGEAVGAPIAARPELGLAVGPLELPRYLDRPELITQDDTNRLIVADAHRWGGSLRNDIVRVVADDLGRLLGTARVVIYPTEPRFQARYRVLLDLRDLRAVRGERVALVVRWTVADLAGDGRALVVEESRIEQPLSSRSYDELVAAESAAFGSLSRRIAERIAALLAQ
jgi:uncharacterized lipoprotein YmbA